MQCTSASQCCLLTGHLTRPRIRQVESLRPSFRKDCVRGLAHPVCCSSTAAQTADAYIRRLQQAVCTAVVSCGVAGAAFAAEPAEVFQRGGCIGCHAGGGNIVQAGASLQTSDLEKNGAATTDTIYKLIYSGKGKMPGYGKDCAPRGKCTFGPRLPDEDIQRLSQYVLDQAAVKWK